MKKTFTIDDSLKIKGIAILFMIFHHLFRLEEFSRGYDVNFFPLTIGRTAQIATFMKICVPIFVFLSGYGLLASYEKMKDKKNFFLVRYLKLMPTFWFVAVVSFVVIQIFTGDVSAYYLSHDIYYGFANILFDILGINGLVPVNNYSVNWWYIGASLIFIFLLPILYKSAKKYGWFNIGLAIVMIPRIFNINNVSTTTALPYIFIFYLGMVAYNFNLFEKIKTIKLNIFIKFLFYLAILLVLYLIHSHYPRNQFWELHFGFIPLIVILFAYEFIIKIPGLSFILKKLGEHSYIMFLTHGFIIEYFKDFIYSFDHMILIMLVLTIISFLVSVLITLLMKITKYNDLFKFIEKKYFC